MVLNKMNYKPEMGAILGHNLDQHMQSVMTAEAQMTSSGPASFIVFYANDEQSLASGLEFAQANRIDDAIVWVLYPKQTSKTYKSSINRDDIFRLAPNQGYNTVRQVAFDDNLSALRVKRT